MQISAALPSMTTAPSNVKKREIHKGGYPAYEIEYFSSRPAGPELFCCVKGVCHERLPAPADRRHAEAGDGLQGHRQKDQAVTGQRTELLQVAPPRRLRQSGGGCLQRGASV